MFSSRFIIIIMLLTLLGCSMQPQQKVAGIQQETGVLQAKKGFTGDILGAEVVNVTTDEALQVQSIHVKIPIDPARVDRLEVVSVNGKVIAEDRTAQILRDYDNNTIGVTVYLAKQSNWAFKLKFFDDVNSD